MIICERSYKNVRIFCKHISAKYKVLKETQRAKLS